MWTRFKRWLSKHVRLDTVGQEPVVVARLEMFKGGGCEISMEPGFTMSLTQVAAVVNFLKIACGFNLEEIREIERRAESNLVQGPWIH